MGPSAYNSLNNKVVYMFKALSSLVLIFSLNAAADEAPLLNSETEKGVLTYFDDVCGDSFCAGDFEYSFDSFSCEKSAPQEYSCRLEVTMTTIDYLPSDDGIEAEIKKAYKAVCTTSSIKKASDVIDFKYSRGNRIELNEKFEEGIGNCFAQLEEHFSK